MRCIIYSLYTTTQVLILSRKIIRTHCKDIHYDWRRFDNVVYVGYIGDIKYLIREFSWQSKTCEFHTTVHGEHGIRWRYDRCYLLSYMPIANSHCLQCTTVDTDRAVSLPICISRTVAINNCSPQSCLRNRLPVGGGCVYVLQLFFFVFCLLFFSVHQNYETTVLGNG